MRLKASPALKGLIKIFYPHVVNGSQWTTSLTLSAYVFTKVA